MFKLLLSFLGTLIAVPFMLLALAALIAKPWAPLIVVPALALAWWWQLRWDKARKASQAVLAQALAELARKG